MAPTLRTFLAFELPEAVLDPVLTFCEWLQEQTAAEKLKLRYVKPSQCHLTLRFFGDMTFAECAMIEEVVAEVLTEAQAPRVEVGTIGCFPAWRRPRVLWVGLDDLDGQLLGLFAKLDDAFAHAGLGRHDRPSFTPHVTLARIKHAPGRRLQQLLGGRVEQGFGQCRLQDLTFFQSELTPRGPIYSPLQQWQLP